MIQSRWLWASLVAVVALLVAPGAWSGVLNGAPLSGIGRMVLVSLAACAMWSALFRPLRNPSRRLPWLLCAIVAGKLAVGVIDGPAGWVAGFTVTGTTPRSSPFFSRFERTQYRIDPRIAFQGPEFQLHFLNDVERFNKTPTPRMITLPIDMTWSTWVVLAQPGTVAVTVRTESTVDVLLDQHSLGPRHDTKGWTAEAKVSAGPHKVTITCSKPAHAPASIAADLSLDHAPVALQAFENRGPLGPIASALSDGLVLAGLALFASQMWLVFHGTLRPRLDAPLWPTTIVWLGCCGLLVWAVVLAHPQLHVAAELGPGEDWLGYESNARNVMEEGLLMPLGKPIGRGQPYFFYPLYSYFLAGVHWMIGEDYGAVILANGICGSVVPVMFWAMGWYRLSKTAQVAGTLTLVLLIGRHSGYWRHALTDNLFLPLVIGAIWAAARAVQPGQRWVAALAGLMAALAGSARPSFLLFVGSFVLLLVLIARPLALRERLLRSGAFVLAYFVGLSPFVARNYVMSGQVTMVATLSHALTVALVPPEGGITAPRMLHYPPSWGEALSAAGQMFRARPGLLTWLEIRKVLFTIGFTNLGPPGIPLQPEFPVLFLLAAVAVWFGRVPRHLLIGISAFVVSHLAAVVIAYPWTYGYKTILPVQYLFLFCALHLTSRRGSATKLRTWPSCFPSSASMRATDARTE